MPTEPGKNAIGMNTDISTSVMPMTAPVICPIAFSVASRGGSPSSAMMRSTFSTTTYVTPGGKNFASSVIFALIASAVASAFAVGEGWIAMAAAGLPLRRVPNE